MDLGIICRDCQQPFDIKSFPYRCPECGGLFGFSQDLPYTPESMDQDQPGIWKYQDSFNLPQGAPIITLGEGKTPLIWNEYQDRQVGYKLESLNPTGSFKDRGSAVLLSWLMAAGVEYAVEDSSGNAGSSFAAYASRSGLKGKVYIPAYASGPKRTQIESYGAEVIPVPGPRSKAAEAVLQEVKAGAVYASHAYLPHGTAGLASIAFELFEEIGTIPGTMLIPVGHGSLLLGIYLGFRAIISAGLAADLPSLVGVQAAACAPLWQAFQDDLADPAPVSELETIAEGVSIADPFHGSQVLAAVRESKGIFLKAAEQDIKAGQYQLSHQGIYAEPTSGLVWAGLKQLPDQFPDPVISIITGHGLKSLSTVA
jgi:threonine synthase